MCKKTEKLYHKTANELLVESGQDNSVPVDVEAILRYYGISALPMNFASLNAGADGSNIIGAMICSHDNVAIFYGQDKTMTSHRVRFTIAHELAHICLTGQENHVEFRHDEDSGDQIEVAANVFAGELLIPATALKETIKKLFLPTVGYLAKAFDVSINVMRQRLAYLNWGDSVLE